LGDGNGVSGGFLGLIFLGGREVFLQGVFEKEGGKRWFLDGNLRSFGGHSAVLIRTDLGIEKKARF
jgi:hypothetical protein